MNTRTFSYLIIAILTFTLGAVWAHYGGPFGVQSALADTDQKQQQPQQAPALIYPGENPIVATAAHKYTTEMEEDPFNPERVRRTRTTVTSVVVVHADGSVQTKRVK